MKHSFILSLLLLTFSQSLSAQTYCLHYGIASLSSTQVVLKVSLSASSAFTMGDANLVFNFNANALSAPSLVSTTLNGFYSPTTVTNPAVGLASINIDFNGAVGQGIAVTTTPTEVARIQFTIDNANLTTGFSINSQYCVAYNDVPTLLDIGSGCSNLNVVLPLEWLDFQSYTTTAKGIRNVNLDWVTASEQNIQHFVVERSRDGKNFEKIGANVAGKNTFSKNDYHIIDPKPWLGVSFYRIRAVSFSGKESFSVVRSVVLDDVKTTFTIHPNPKAGEAPLSIQTNWIENYVFNLYDATGKLVYSRNCKGSIELNDLNLATGFYLYECATPQDKMTGKLVVP